MCDEVTLKLDWLQNDETKKFIDFLEKQETDNQQD
jgi:hypothetical protein